MEMLKFEHERTRLIIGEFDPALMMINNFQTGTKVSLCTASEWALIGD